MIVHPTFDDHAPRPSVTPAEGRCRVRVSQITDARRDPQTLGMIDRRAIRSPPDAVAWLRTILGGLEARGLAVDFEPETAAPDAVTAQVALQTAWATNVRGNLVVNVVLHVTANGPRSAAIDRYYRGNTSRIYWVSVGDEIQNVVDLAFVNVLNDLATDLRAACPA